MLLSRIYKPQEGNIEIDEQNIWNYKIKDFAKKVAVVHQKNQIYGDQDVKTIVGYGRLPYLHYSQKLTAKDYEIIDWALEVTHLKEYQNRTLKSLSGGQQQRVWIAMALAQKTPYLLLDEPTNGLDPAGIHEIRNLVKSLPKRYDCTILISSHMLSEIELLADDIGILNHGRLLFEGSLEDLKFTAHESGFENDNLEEMFLSMIDEDNKNRKQRLKL